MIIQLFNLVLFFIYYNKQISVIIHFVIETLDSLFLNILQFLKLNK